MPERNKNKWDEGSFYVALFYIKTKVTIISLDSQSRAIYSILN